jgi:peptidoglycan hydrolase-like protein with peptidoglycan-binding domain
MMMIRIEQTRIPMRIFRLLPPLLILLSLCLALAGTATAQGTSPTSAELRRMQETLRLLGFDPGGVDGLLGSGTRSAIRNFQTRHRLPVTGSPDSALRERLERELLRAIQSELTALGFDPGEADGLWGERTANAIGAYRRQNNSRAATGGASPELLRQLRDSRQARDRRQETEAADIRTLQASLTVLGFDTGGVDGALGPSTRSSIRAFQQRNGLNADGQASAVLRARVGTELVRFIQQRLKALGFEPGTVDGQVGDLTRAAIHAFEQRQGLNPTGEPTAALAAQLETTFRSRQQSPTVESEQLRQVQQRLKALGYDPGPIDGRPGPGTREAIRRYQRSLDRPETGELTPELLTRLTAADPPAEGDAATAELSTAELISEIQARLNSLGYNAGPTDGQPGPRTESSIRSAQRHLGLPETGRPSRQLLERLRNTPVDQARAPPIRGRRLANGNTEVRGMLQMQHAGNGELLGCSIDGVQLDRAWCTPFVDRSTTDNCRAVIRPDTRVLLVKCS